MRVKVHEVTLTVNEKEKRLTKVIARQFPILDGRERWRAAELGQVQPEPICKVMGSVLGSTHRWLYLVSNEEAGLAWVAATEMGIEYAEMVLERGGWVDKPADVPTAIL